MSERCVHGHVTDDAGQHPCVNCLRAKLTTRDLQIHQLERRLEDATEDSLRCGLCGDLQTESVGRVCDACEDDHEQQLTKQTARADAAEQRCTELAGLLTHERERCAGIAEEGGWVGELDEVLKAVANSIRTRTALAPDSAQPEEPLPGAPQRWNCQGCGAGPFTKFTADNCCGIGATLSEGPTR